MGISARITTNIWKKTLQQPEILPPALGVQVQVGRLAQRADAVAGPRLGVVVRGAVPHTPVVPDGQVVAAPLEADLGVVVLGDEVEEVLQQDVGLVLGNAVDALGEAPVDENGFPTGYGCEGWGGLLTNFLFFYLFFFFFCVVLSLGGKGQPLTIRPNHRMHRRQRIALVQRVAPYALAQRVAQPGGLVAEKRGVVRGGEPLEHGAHRGAQAVVGLVAAGPERVAAGGRQGVDLEHGVVGGDGLECDVGVPPGRGEAARVGALVREAAALGLLGRRDDADLVAELAALLGQGVDVEGGGLGLWGGGGQYIVVCLLSLSGSTPGERGGGTGRNTHASGDLGDAEHQVLHLGGRDILVTEEENTAFRD